MLGVRDWKLGTRHWELVLGVELRTRGWELVLDLELGLELQIGIGNLNL